MTINNKATFFSATKLVAACSPGIIIASFLIFSFPSSAIAETDSSIRKLHGTELNQFIANYASSHIPHQDDETVEASVTKLKQNIILPACPADIDIAISKQTMGGIPSSVTLSCQEQPQWNIFIPINVKILTNVIVANRQISSGETITANDITFEKQDKNLLNNGFFKDEKLVVGQIARYSINTGVALTKNNVKPLPIIKNNQTITLIVKTGGIEIQMLGIAKSDGFLNDRINVLNPSSKKIIDAIVVSSTQAEINY